MVMVIGFLGYRQDDDDAEDDDEGVDADESHMLSTVYLVEASWVGGTILRWHQQPNRHGDHMIYEQFQEILHVT